MNKPGWTCKFCEREFKLEARYLKHKCKWMVRDEEIRSPTGQAAWSYYQRWMKAYRRLVPSIHSFTRSKFYTSFYNFAQRAEELNMPDVSMFIKLMQSKDIPPNLWCNDQVYAMYIEFLDRRADPMDQARITVDTLFKLADAHDVSVSDVFDHVEPHEIIQLFRQRQLSPWLMLQCQKFKQYFVEKTNQDQKIVLESIIRPQYWGFKFSKHTAEVAKMKLYAKELNL